MYNDDMRITITPQETIDYPFITKDGKAAFYRFITEKALGIPYDSIKSLDCRRINVATNIQESWFEYAKANNIMQEELCMILAVNGPKAFEDLPINCVELESECVEW